MQPIAHTIKEYEHDSFLTSLVTTLCGIAETGEAKVAFTETIFFAEGGGQPADRGTVVFGNGKDAQTAQVCDVHEKDGVVWHTLNALPEGLCLGDCVTCTLDWTHRLDSMQQHTGEHILSGILHQLYGAENVGFHIGRELVRMDTSCPLSAQQLQHAEEQANEIIWQNVTINTLLPSTDALHELAYRSKKEIDGQVRIVQIAGADTCACCGTHLHQTGQVGQIKILTSEHYKGGERLSIVCGKRALNAAQDMRNREAEIGALLSAKPALTAQAVHRIYDELTALKFAKQGIELQLFEALCKQILPDEPAIFTVNGLTPDGLHKLASLLSETTTALCAALCETVIQPTDGTGAYCQTGYCLAQSGNADLRPICKALNATLDGRGGGKPNIVQGSAKATAAAVTTFLQTYETCGNIPHTNT